MTSELIPDSVTPLPPGSPALAPDTYTMTPDEVIVPSSGGCSDGGPIQSYLYFNGAEVANGARTLSYMRSGSVFGECYPKFSVSPGTPCWVQEQDAGGGPFTSPAADPAPWYDATVPASGEFLGLLIEPDSQAAFFDGFSTRSVNDRLGGLGGAQIGPARVQARSWVVKGWLIASTCQGMNYGRRWLENTLDGLGCDPCSLYQMQMRDSCPPCTDPTRENEGLWFAYEAALTDGPKYQTPVDDCCCAQEVQFTITCGNGYLYGSLEACATGTSPVADYFTTPNPALTGGLLFCAGFDQTASTDDLAVGATGGFFNHAGGSLTLSGTGARHGFGLRIQKTSVNQCWWGPQGGAADQCWPAGHRSASGCVHLYVNTLPSAETTLMQWQCTGTSENQTLTLDVSGNLRLCTSDPSGSAFHNTNSQFHLPVTAGHDLLIEWYIDTSVNPHTLTLRVTGNTDPLLVHQYAVGAADLSGVVLGSPGYSSPATYDVTFDDFVVFDCAPGSVQFTGDHRVEHLLPDSTLQAGSDVVLHGAATIHQALQSIDDATSYISATTTGGDSVSPLVGFANLALLGASEVIIGAMLNARVGGNQSSLISTWFVKGWDSTMTLPASRRGNGQIDAKVNGWQWGHSRLVDYMPIFYRPPGGGAWTPANFDDMAVGILPQPGTSAEVDMTYLALETAIFIGVEACAPFDTWFCSVLGETCCAVEPPLLGVLGAVVTVTAGSGVRNMTLSTYDSCDPATRTLLDTLTITSLEAGSTLVINSAIRTVTYTDATGAQSDGTPFIMIPSGQGFPWLELAECDEARCVCVTYGAFCTLDGSQQVSIQTQQRVA